MTAHPTEVDELLIEARRRPLTFRGRSTRLRLLQATVECLTARGYAATTTQAVAELANVSRGSLLHQFQTRVDMMAAAADFVMGQMIEYGRRRFEDFPDPVTRLRNLCLVVEDLQQEPASLALNEILLAARWETGLATHLSGVALNIERVMDADVMHIAAEAGIPDPGQLQVRSRAIIAAMRGFAIELMFNADRAVIHEAIRMTRADYDRWLDDNLP